MREPLFTNPSEPDLCFLILRILRRALPRLQAGLPGVLRLLQLDVLDCHVHDDLPGNDPPRAEAHELSEEERLCQYPWLLPSSVGCALLNARLRRGAKNTQQEATWLLKCCVQITSVFKRIVLINLKIWRGGRGEGTPLQKIVLHQCEPQTGSY